MKVRYTKSALNQLEAILTYIQMHSPQGSKKVQGRICELINVLETHPFIGVTTSDRRIRRVVATPYPYVILYQSSLPQGKAKAQVPSQARLPAKTLARLLRPR
ncbi:MAG: type II toxin-antitoxin system RelE/ParE family toxin [Rhodomicrobium sp.]|nr:type II toxin-antitoxin system RelE/ParE family toxin [Rhodomicrobium sp.]